MRTLLALLALSLFLIGISPNVSDAAPGLIRSWGGFGTSPGQFNNPYGIVVDGNQVVYVTDEANNRIQTFDTTGVFLNQWGTFGSNPGQLFNPTGIDIGPDGFAYVSDHQNHRISVFRPSGVFVRVFTAPDLSYPVGLNCEPSGNLWVASLSGLFHFSSTGTLLQSIGMFNGESPYGITADGNTLYASLCGANRIDQITLSPFSEQPFAASGLYCPEGSLLDANGDFIVCDTGHDRVLKFDPSGVMIGQLLLSTNPRAIPSDIALDSSGALYITEWGLHQIEKYSAGAFVSAPKCDAIVSAGGPYQTASTACVQLNGVVSDPNLPAAWATSGSGSFSPDNTTISPLYCPSAADVAAGSVTLTLTAGSCPSSNATLTITASQNQPPDCSFAFTSVAPLFPADHKMTPVVIAGVFDPEGGPVTVTVTGITQNEPIDKGGFCPDAQILPDGSAIVRRERGRNGRIYEIAFTATDQQSATCEGVLRICVPSNRGNPQCGEGPLVYDSLGPCPAGGLIETAIAQVEQRGPVVTVDYTTAQAAQVKLDLFDVAGRRVGTLVNETLEAGSHSAAWNAGHLSKGLYFLRVQSSDAQDVRRLFIR